MGGQCGNEGNTKSSWTNVEEDDNEMAQEGRRCCRKGEPLRSVTDKANMEVESPASDIEEDYCR